jgi:hypothetical protein
MIAKKLSDACKASSSVANSVCTEFVEGISIVLERIWECSIGQQTFRTMARCQNVFNYRNKGNIGT